MVYAPALDLTTPFECGCLGIYAVVAFLGCVTHKQHRKGVSACTTVNNHTLL